MIENLSELIIEKIIHSSRIIENTKELSTMISEIINDISDCFEKGNKVILFGNGGSAADAQHIAAEFIGRF